MMQFLQAVAGLAVVLAAIAGSAWLMRRVVRVHASSGSPLTLRATLPVGPRERVMVLEIENTWIVVGVAPGRVSPLHALPKGSVAPAAGSAAPLPTAEPAASPQTPFAALLRRVLPDVPR